MVDHIPGCAILAIRECPAGTSLHGELIKNHWWSGWPGAYCLKCGDDDHGEFCISTNCLCHCHNEFWEEYNAHMLKEQENEDKTDFESGPQTSTGEDASG